MESGAQPRDTARAVPEKDEKVGALYEAMNRGDFDDAVECLHRDVEIQPALGGVMDIARRYSGRDEARQLMETITEGIERIETRVEPKEAIEVGDDRLLRVERWHPRGRQGMETEVVITQVYTFRDGLILRIDGFRDRAEALEAAGLRE
jgi:ketosteroid isomerase-like protein